MAWLLPLAAVVAACSPLGDERPPVGADRATALDQVRHTARSAGTGFFVGPGSHLLTAAHVVAGCGAVWAVSHQETVSLARVLAVHDDLDVAVLRADQFPAPHARLASASHEPGAGLLALGYPPAATDGRAAAVPFRVVELPLPRPDERVALRGGAQPGMSGSPLLDTEGRVAGMLLGKGDPAVPGSPRIEQRLGFSVAEIAVMVPAPWLRAVASLAGVPQPAAAAPARGDEARGEAAVVRVVCTGALASGY